MRIECSACGDTHALRVESGLAGAVDAVDISLCSRGDEQIAFGTEGQPCGIENSGHKRGSTSVGAYTNHRDRRLLAALSGYRGINHAGTADGRACNWM